ncbi:MAG: metal ABC transporter ATP-binding protein [Candidatus Dormibacteria bacterium]
MAETVVDVQHASVRVHGRTIWSDATFTVPAGSFTAVVGPNGAGKTTLLRVLLGLVPAESGMVRVLGRAPRRGDADIGYVPQRRTLDPEIPVRGRDLVALGADGHRWGFRLPRSKADGAEMDAALNSVHAAAFADRRIGRLSGGEQQRLLIAQALVGNPKLLLLDEPLASLDVRNQVTVARIVDDVVRTTGVATLVVTHDINPILGFIDQVVYVAQGRVVAGRPEEVVNTGALSSIYGAQVEVLRDSHGHVFVVGLDQEAAHPHGR